MERAGTLIERLKEQHESGSRASEMMITAQMLLQELYIISAGEGSNQQKVSMMVPKMNVPPKKEVVAEERVQKAEIQKPIVSEEPKTKEKPYSSYEKYLPADKTNTTDNISKPEPAVNFLVAEQKEVHESISTPQESLNDKLKTSASEKEHILYEAPIKDLRTAIGINDRFRFIQELFRGDESVYERSIITINSFTQYNEAEYWIQRELKVKSGWDDSSEVVQQFNQLVRRRFS